MKRTCGNCKSFDSDADWCDEYNIETLTTDRGCGCFDEEVTVDDENN